MDATPGWALLREPTSQQDPSYRCLAEIPDQDHGALVLWCFGAPRRAPLGRLGAILSIWFTSEGLFVDLRSARNEDKTVPQEDRNGGFSERRAALYLPDLCTSFFAAAPATPDVTDRTTGKRSKVGDPGTSCGIASRFPPSREHLEPLTCPAKTMWRQIRRRSSFRTCI